MTNYFGLSRIKKILYTYISSDRPELVKKLAEDEKEYGCRIFNYRKYRGSEWVKYYGDGGCMFEIWADGHQAKVISIDEYRYNGKKDVYVSVKRIVSYYSEVFIPSPNNRDKSLDCYKIAKRKGAYKNAEVKRKSE